jgi:hypothetical protein
MQPPEHVLRYIGLDRIDAHHAEIFTHLQARWKDLFGGFAEPANF